MSTYGPGSEKSVEEREDFWLDLSDCLESFGENVNVVILGVCFVFIIITDKYYQLNLYHEHCVHCVVLVRGSYSVCKIIFIF